jgi:hypothetical protein
MPQPQHEQPMVAAQPLRPAAMWSRLRWRCWRRPRWRRPCGEWRTGTHAWSCTRQPIGCGQQEAGIKGAGGPTAAGRRSSSAWRCWLRRPRSVGAWPRTGISALDSCRLTCARPRFGLQLGLSSVGSWGGRQRLGRGLTPAALDDHAVMIFHTTSRPALRAAASGGRPHCRGGRGHRRPHRRAGRGRPHRHALHPPGRPAHRGQCDRPFRRSGLALGLAALLRFTCLL